MAACCDRDLPKFLSVQGLELFEEQQGAPPAIVSIASNFWDIASL